MAQSRGTKKVSRIIATCLSMMLVLSGCGADVDALMQQGFSADWLRPDIFRDSDMRAFPVWADGEAPDDGGDSTVQQGSEVAVWPNGSPKNPNYSYTRPTTTDKTENFAGMPKEAIQCSDYTQYLRAQVFEELRTAILQLPEDVRNKLYLRCGHTGYDLDSSGNLRRKNGWQDTWSGTEISSASMVGGDTLMLMASDWLSGLPDNKDHVALQVEAAQNAIRKVAKDEDWAKTWYGLGDTAIPQIYKNMLGRDGLSDTTTLQEYYDLIATDPMHNIPNFSLQMRAGESSTDTVLFNKASTSAAEQYHTGVSLDTVDKMFRTQNQYSDRNREPIDQTKQGDSSIVRYYIDGYNKTAIFIGCKDGENLLDLVGEDTYRYFLKKINEAASCVDVSAITSIVPQPVYEASSGEYVMEGPDYSVFVPIPAGTKGAD